MSSPAATPESARSYDLWLRASTSRLFGSERGVTLAGDTIAWSVDGRADHGHLRGISEVRLQTGGSPTSPTALCYIQFSDGFLLTLSNVRAIGSDAQAQDAIYRAFVVDPHRRLSAVDHSGIRFVAGYPERKYWIVLMCAVALGVISVGIPVVFLIIAPDFKLIGLLFGGAIFIWPFVTMLQANGPRSYDPRHLPRELLS
jgi:hypothetical protein